jgi:hypothetical protein
MRLTANTKPAIAVTLNELATSGNDGCNVERDGRYGASSAAASLLSSSIMMPLRLTLR